MSHIKFKTVIIDHETRLKPLEIFYMLNTSTKKAYYKSVNISFNRKNAWGLLLMHLRDLHPEYRLEGVDV